MVLGPRPLRTLLVSNDICEDILAQADSENAGKNFKLESVTLGMSQHCWGEEVQVG